MNRCQLGLSVSNIRGNWFLKKRKECGRNLLVGGKFFASSTAMQFTCFYLNANIHGTRIHDVCPIFILFSLPEPE